MNADISDNNSVFAKHLNNFCTDSNSILSSRELLPAASYTYISEAWHTTSWLDHCICTADAHAALVHIDILYNVSIVDQIPFEVSIRFDHIPATVNVTSNHNQTYIDWSSLSDEKLAGYCAYTDQLLCNIKLPREAVTCTDCN